MEGLGGLVGSYEIFDLGGWGVDGSEDLVGGVVERGEEGEMLKDWDDVEGVTSRVV